MKRIILIFLSAISFVTCAGACVMWVRSHHLYDDFSWATRNMYCECLSGGGELHLEAASRVPISTEFSHRSDGVDDLDDKFAIIYSSLHPVGTGFCDEGSFQVERFGFGYMHGNYDFLKSGEEESGSSSPVIGLRAPYWAVVMMFGILPACFLLTSRHRRRKVGMCGRCGYDLRATPVRCPECGTKSTSEMKLPAMSLSSS